MANEVLTDQSFLLYAAKHYNNPCCFELSEFKEDLARIKYVKKLITRYIQSGEIQERLILNHLITLNNVFGPEVLVKIIFLKMEAQLKYIKPFLILLNILPEMIYNVKKENAIIYTDSIEMDQKIIEILRKI